MSSPSLNSGKLSTRFAAFSLFSLIVLCLPSSEDGPDKDFRKTAFVTCWDEDWKNFATREAKSPWLNSPGGEYGAYAMVVAQAIGEGPMGDCENTSQIFLRKTVGAEAKKIYELASALEGPKGNGVVLIDWSADSRLVLVDLLTWYYFSEGWEHTLLLYDTREDAISSIILNEVFSSLRGESCAVDAHLVGFTKEGNVVMDAMPMGDPEMWLSCVDEPGRWSLNPSSRKLARETAKLKVKRFGKKGAQGNPKGP